MRKFLLTLFFVVATFVIAGYVFSSPWVMEAGIRFTCRDSGERCVVRMRSMGHIWSKWGYLRRAEYWYARGAENGDRAAMFHLGWVYEEEGLGDVRRFINEEYGTPGLVDQAAIIFNELLASWTGGGEPKKDAQRRLSLEKNSHALEWYRKSAELGFIPAMNNLGQLYLNGALGYRDAGEAFRWHLAAAEAGNFIGAMNVGMAFRSGLGVAADPAEAQRWSQWKSSTSDLSDLTEPTFERTYLPGRNSLPPQRRHMVRVAAARGEIVTMSVGSLKPNDKLPTFKSVVRGLKN